MPFWVPPASDGHWFDLNFNLYLCLQIGSQNMFLKYGGNGIDWLKKVLCEILFFILC